MCNFIVIVVEYGKNADSNEKIESLFETGHTKKAHRTAEFTVEKNQQNHDRQAFYNNLILLKIQYHYYVKQLFKQQPLCEFAEICCLFPEQLFCFKFNQRI